MPTTTQEAQTMEARYQRAVTFERGSYCTGATLDHGDQIVLNSIVIPAWLDDRTFLYKKSVVNGFEFRYVDVEHQNNDAAFDHSVLALALEHMTEQAVDEKRLPITKVGYSHTPFQLRFLAFDRHWQFDGNVCIEIEKPPEYLVSPNGEKAVFVRDYNVWLNTFSNREEQQLTADGDEAFQYGAASLVWGFEGDPLKHQMIWSADSSKLFVVQRDTRSLREVTTIDYVPDEGIYPVARTYKTAFPGDKQVENFRLAVIDVNTGVVIPAQHSPIPTFGEGGGIVAQGLAWWSADNQFVYFIDVERGERTASVVELNAATGATRVLFKETASTFVSRSPLCL